MNILITNDDGPQAHGLKLMREAVAKHFRSPTVITLVPERDVTGIGTGLIAHDLEAMKVTQREPDFYTAPGSPMDMIDLAFLHSDQFLSRGNFELVLVGVNRGANTGVDCFRSGTVMAAAAASTFYGCCAWAFSQEVPDEVLFEGVRKGRIDPKEEPKYFPQTYDLLMHYFQTTSLEGSECWNVNFPATPARSMRQTKVAHYSRYRKPPLDVVPRANGEESDIVLLSQGWATVSEISLRLNPGGRF
jgi:5'/3'-nucleotidase SurE